jgi:sortase A
VDRAPREGDAVTSIMVRPKALRRRAAAPDTTGEVDHGPEARTAPADLRTDVVRVVGRGFTTLGLLVVTFAVYLLAITPLLHARDQRGLDRRFRDYVASQQAWVGGVIPEGEPVAKLVIPSLGVDEIVVEGTSGSELRKGPGHLRTSALPGQAGNAVLAGHRVAFGGTFRHIDRLRKGDLIVATTGQAVNRYRVTGVAEVAADQHDVLGPTADNRLTLITSAPMLRASRRLVVTAELRRAPLPTQAARPIDLRTDELGLHGDRSGGFGLLLWLEALAVATLAAVWLRRRWARWTSWLVVAPVLALLLLLVFDSFVPVLPSTL